MKRIPALPLALALNLSFACTLTPEVERLASRAARAAGLEPHLLTALLWQESRFCHLTEEGELTTSHTGALGIGQLMPDTAASLDVDPHDLTENIEGAARYLRMQWDTFGDWPLALAAYNAGPGAVQAWNSVPPYPETQRYVTEVLSAYRERTTEGSTEAKPGAHPNPVIVSSAPEITDKAVRAVVSRREHHVASAVIYRR